MPGSHGGLTEFRSTTVQTYFREENETPEIQSNIEELTETYSSSNDDIDDEFTSSNAEYPSKQKRGRRVDSKNKPMPQYHSAALQDTFAL